MIEHPKILTPYDKREAISLRVAAEIAGRSESTMRSWCQNHYIGRRIVGGQWEVSKPALLMLLDGDARALRAYLQGDRESDLVGAYFRRANIPLPHNERA
ncbi:hypothetical protein [Methylocystis sp.]|uniref:hypothetical protein n=1 Tax=Methylocystis sp. TaxID=1911079 RepID=UPI0025E96986|nr:hypothetical protein [Methylocystis sp.]